MHQELSSNLVYFSHSIPNMEYLITSLLISHGEMAFVVHSIIQMYRLEMNNFLNVFTGNNAIEPISMTESEPPFCPRWRLCYTITNTSAWVQWLREKTPALYCRTWRSHNYPSTFTPGDFHAYSHLTSYSNLPVVSILQAPVRYRSLIKRRSRPICSQLQKGTSLDPGYKNRKHIRKHKLANMKCIKRHTLYLPYGMTNHNKVYYNQNIKL